MSWNLGCLFYVLLSGFGGWLIMWTGRLGFRVCLQFASGGCRGVYGFLLMLLSCMVALLCFTVLCWAA